MNASTINFRINRFNLKKHALNIIRLSTVNFKAKGEGEKGRKKTFP